MEYQIVKNPVGMVEFALDWGESVTAEAGAMVFSRGDLKIDTKTRKGGLLTSLKSSVLASESFFVNEFTAQEDGCRLGLTGKAMGDLEAIRVDQEYVVQAGSYVASTGNVSLDTKWQGLTKGLFGTNLFMLKTSGAGDVFVSAWGGIREERLDRGESIILDNYRLVALTAATKYAVRKHGSLKTAVLGGEMLVIDISGPGTVYFQTKNPAEFAGAVAPFVAKGAAWPGLPGVRI